MADGCERPLQRPQHAATPVAWRSGIGEGNILPRFLQCSNQIFQSGFLQKERKSISLFKFMNHLRKNCLTCRNICLRFFDICPLSFLCPRGPIVQPLIGLPAHPSAHVDFFSSFFSSFSPSPFPSSPPYVQSSLSPW